MKLSKCHFFTKEIQYLGHILSIKGIKPLPSKTQAIKNMHPPKTPKQVCTFLGLIRYYRKFIRNFAKIAKPLTLLTHQQAKFEWTPTHHNAFWHSRNQFSKHLYYTIQIQWNILHSIHRCIRQCLWSTTIMRTWWNRIPNSFSFTYLHGHTMQMEHHRTRSLQCVLCSHKMELLPPRSWSHSMQWPQTTGKISQWKECQ